MCLNHGYCHCCVSKNSIIRVCCNITIRIYANVAMEYPFFSFFFSRVYGACVSTANAVPNAARFMTALDTIDRYGFSVGSHAYGRILRLHRNGSFIRVVLFWVLLES